MNAVPMSARLRCKHCNHKVPLSREQVRELSGRLRAEVGCPACGQRFSASLLRTPKETASPPADPIPIPIPVPTGAKQAPPPFRPLPAVRDAADPTPRPPVEWQPTAVAPGADPLPFSPLQTAPTDTSKPTGGTGGWWKRQSKKTQYLILGTGIVAMAGFAFTVQTLTSKPKQQHQQQPTEVSPPTQATNPSPHRPVVKPDEPPPEPQIDQLSPDQLRIAEPTPDPTPSPRR